MVYCMKNEWIYYNELICCMYVTKILRCYHYEDRCFCLRCDQLGRVLISKGKGLYDLSMGVPFGSSKVVWSALTTLSILLYYNLSLLSSSLMMTGSWIKIYGDSLSLDPLLVPENLSASLLNAVLSSSCKMVLRATKDSFRTECQWSSAIFTITGTSIGKVTCLYAFKIERK